jgi:transcriptional regulator with XRE-family HTH domain
MADENIIPGDSLAALQAELVRARTKAGLSIVDLHEQTQISRAVLLGYERGRTRPGAREIKLLCEALKITPNKLIFGTEDPFEKHPLYESLGIDSDASRMMKMMGLFSVLTRSEQDSLLQLSSSIVASRHGQEAILSMESAYEVAGEMMQEEVQGFADKVSDGMTENKSKEIEQKMKDRVRQKKNS